MQFPRNRVLAAMLLFLAVSTSVRGDEEHPTLAIGSPAPNFSLPGIDGRTHQLSDYGAAYPGVRLTPSFTTAFSPTQART